MATEHTPGPTAAPSRGPQGRTFENPRERLLAELPVIERRLSLNGVTTAVLEGGEGSPVVLLHGPGGYGAHWLSIIANLATTHRVIAPDLPGHGESGMFAAPPDPGRRSELSVSLRWHLEPSSARAGCSCSATGSRERPRVE
jgi:pimeloyl-ACP methyl ester carboxylesterase